MVVEASPSAIVVTNDDGRIELVNRQVEKLFGYARDELLGQSVDMLLPERFRPQHPALRGNFAAAPSMRPMGAGRDLFARTKSGKDIPVEIGLNPIHTESGLLILSSIIDISERKAAEARLREKNEQIAAASRYKSEFLANMSHELRTPLNSILILSEQLSVNLPGNLTPKQKAHADIIHRCGCDLLALINDILDLSKIEAGRMTVMTEKVIVTDFAESVEHTFHPLAETKRLEFTVDVESDTASEIQSDHQRIFQIIRNLFSNALKFTNSGAIRIRFFTPQQVPDALNAGDGVLAISVCDTGLGIEPDKHALIFEAFRQVDGSISRRFGGTGLGLTISRQLADLLGGKIDVASELGRGSTFTLYLPVINRRKEAAEYLLEAEDEPHAGSQACGGAGREKESLFSEPVVENEVEPAWSTPPTISTHTPLLSHASAKADPSNAPQALPPSIPFMAENAIALPPGKRVLVVDDDIRNIYAMCSLLEEMGLETATSKNGEEALNFLERHDDIDLVLMDMMMPVVDGYAATRELKRNRGYTRPIVALTAHAL
ncbi:MAG TPA: ATP-binding protein, partial [Burkholderiaceae bacterium]|nr:ATP-binding protein [Burkholderiaceae bacterium]